MAGSFPLTQREHLELEHLEHLELEIILSI